MKKQIKTKTTKSKKENFYKKILLDLDFFTEEDKTFLEEKVTSNVIYSKSAIGNRIFNEVAAKNYENINNTVALQYRGLEKARDYVAKMSDKQKVLSIQRSLISHLKNKENHTLNKRSVRIYTMLKNDINKAHSKSSVYNGTLLEEALNISIERAKTYKAKKIARVFTKLETLIIENNLDKNNLLRQ